jgi:PAS domain S-box-containing protein
VQTVDPALFGTLTEAIADGLLVTAEDGTIVHVNGRMEALFGYSRDELIGAPLEVLIPESRRGAHAQHLSTYLRDPVPRAMGDTLALTARRKDGTAFPVDISLSPAQGTAGPLVVAVVRDVTERQRLEEERKREQVRHRLFAEHARDIIYHIRLHPPPVYVEYVSPAVLPLTGYSPQELDDDSDLLQRMVHPEDRPVFQRLLADPTSATSPLMVRIVRKDGGIAWHEESIAPILDERGTPVAIECIARDVTDRIEVERERQRLMVEAERQRDRERIALDLHDGVMQTIYGVGLNLQNAATQIATDPGLARSTLDDATMRLRQTIEDIRGYIMGIRPHSRTLEFPAFIDNLVADLRTHTTLIVSVTLPATAPPLRAEQSLAISHVLREALSNIRRHARARQATIEVECADGALSLLVRDDGRGFDTSAPVGADHLGLSSMRARARAIGADLTISSEPAGGTAVRLALPL